MNKALETKVLYLKKQADFVFPQKKAVRMLEEYARYRKKPYVGDLKATILASLKDGNLRVFEGAPGAGKSKMLHIYGLLALEAGYEVAVYSPVVAASRKLGRFVRRIAGVFGLEYRGRVKVLSAPSFAKLEVKPQCVVLVDEAGFLHNDEMDMLLDKIKDSGALLVMSGDVHQIGIKPSENGFVSVIKTMQDSGYQVREVGDIFRQRIKGDAGAVHDLRGGRIGHALHYYADRTDYQSLYFCKNRAVAVVKLANDFVRSKAGSEAVVIASNPKAKEALKAEFGRRRLRAKILLPEEAQGMAVNQSFFLLSQKNILLNELLVAFSRHRYKMMTYIDESAGIRNISALVKSVEV